MIPEAVTSLLTTQAGLATRHQLLEAGMTDSALAWRLRHGWRLVLPRVVVAHRGALSARQRLVAALLFGGEDALVTSMAAAAWHGVTAADVSARVHLLVGPTRGLASTGFVVVRRSVRPDEFPWRRGPLSIVSRPRAVGDAARDSPSADVARAVVLEAVQWGIVRVEDVRHELEVGPRQGGRLLRQAVQEAESRAWSVPEAGLAALCGRSRSLSELWLNPELRTPDGIALPTPDGWFDDVALAVQVHSREYHEGPQEWDDTVMADGVLGEYGISVVQVTPRRLERSPQEVLRRIERHYEAARSRRRPDVVACPIGRWRAS